MKAPDLAALRNRISSKYLLVTITAKRARQLMEGASPKIEKIQGKPVTIAMHEVADGIVVPAVAEN